MNTTDGPKSDRWLLGTDEATIDDKGRVLVGKKKRERLGETFALSVGAEGQLVAYPMAEWERMVTEILSYPSIQPGTQLYSRFVLADAEDDIKFDSQGRFVVPQRLRQIANLKDKIVLVGLATRMEIWAKQEYEEYNAYRDTYRAERVKSIRSAYDLMTGAKPAEKS